ncbi:MAG: alpha-L-fucosidase [Bacteroidota bacterium]|nr:alpha-L-fucosidase [Bacteroidota bacterium]
MKQIFSLSLLFYFFFLISCKNTSREKKVYKQTFEPAWESLAGNEIPEWLMDAKFGIYAHWGVYSVPAFETEWYGKRMYQTGSSIYEHHLKTYGDPSVFGYKEFIPMFHAENYNPAEWVDIIKQSGAKYAGFAVVHHDGFCLWDSEQTRWNSMDMGPKRDLYGDLVKELKKENMKVIATFHNISTFNWYLPWIANFFSKPDSVKRLEYTDKKWDIFDPEFGDLYWNDEIGSSKKDFIKNWRNKVTEVIDAYQPDLLWFDGGVFQDESSENDVQELLCYYYNKQNEWQKPLVVLNKLPGSMKFNFPKEFGMLTFEEGRDRPLDESRPWIDDMKISDIGWCYVEGQNYKTANEIIDGLIDRVSRGGGLLLNLSPKADGTIPEKQKTILREVGDWLKINGEAIYETRPWKIFAEGPQDKFFTKGNHPKWTFMDNCNSGDVRFTTKNDVLYVFALGWPEDMHLNIKSINSRQKMVSGKIRRVTLIGSSKKVKWSVEEDGMHIVLPEKVNDIALVLKLETD